ncbi:MAG: SUF system Fe-S cluster assembly regulator [Deltaproteobacteria bacterium]|nr:SUF system Fe-S cluster assembly regulator [Deltaproteobacteria bacterium]
MLRISKLTDYGILLAVELGELQEPTSVRALSLRTGVPQATASKVLQSLARAGIARSRRGATGGYCLTRPSREIPMLEVLTALEGPLAVTDCVEEGACEHEEGCGTRVSWQRVNEAVARALANVSLADMAPPTPLVALTRSAAHAARLRQGADLSLLAPAEHA